MGINWWFGSMWLLSSSRRIWDGWLCEVDGTGVNWLWEVYELGLCRLGLYEWSRWVNWQLKRHADLNYFINLLFCRSSGPHIFSLLSTFQSGHISAKKENGYDMSWHLLSNDSWNTANVREEMRNPPADSCLPESCIVADTVVDQWDQGSLTVHWRTRIPSSWQWLSLQTCNNTQPTRQTSQIK